jgi:acetyl-CoA carboxylase biotin carboxyl carrier protein
MNADAEYARQIITLVAGSSITDLHLEIGDFKLTLARAAHEGERQQAADAGVTRAGSRAATIKVSATQASAPPAPSRAAVAAVDGSGVAVRAPMVGTFYRASAPGAAPFVEVGSVVAEDQTVCIVEVMKLMNEVRAGCRGRVVAIHAENGALVEYGQPLIVIDPAG